MYHGWPIQYDLMARYCNTWRNYEDVQCNAISKFNSRSCWDSVSTIRDYWGGSSHSHDDYDRFVQVAGPGQWNDAVSEERMEISHMTIISVQVAAPKLNRHVCIVVGVVVLGYARCWKR
jgi:hypothetical protein